jgi:hypothetical protein
LIFQQKQSRLTDLQPWLTLKKPLPTSVPYQTNPWQKWNFSIFTELYPEPVFFAIVQLFTWPQWGAMTMANWVRSLPKMLNFNLNHPGHSNGKNTSKWLLDCQSIKSIHDCQFFNFKSMVVIGGHRLPTISMPVARCSLPTQPLTQPRYLLITPHSLRSAANMFSLTIDSDIFHNMSAWWHS